MLTYNSPNKLQNLQQTTGERKTKEPVNPKNRAVKLEQNISKSVKAAILVFTLVVSISFGHAINVNAAVLAQYTFPSNLASPAGSINPTTTAAGMTVSPITNGATNVYEVSSNGYASDPELRVGPQATTLGGAVTANSYVEFTLTPTGGNELDLTDMTLNAARGGAATPRGWGVRSSLDGYSANISGPNDIPTTRPTWTPYTVDLSGAQYQGLTSAITFRIYFYSPAAGSTVEMDDITVNGTVNTPITPDWGSCQVINGRAAFADGSAGMTVDLAATHSYTISDTSQAFLLVDFAGGAVEQNVQNHMATGYIANTTTLQFNRVWTVGPNAWVSYQLVECFNNEFSVQRGQVQLTAGAGSNTGSLGSPAGVSDSIVLVNSRNTDNTTSQDMGRVRASLQDASTVIVNRVNITGTTTARYEVVTFNSGSGVTVYTGNFTFDSSASASQTQPIGGTVDLSRSWVYGSWDASQDTLSSTTIGLELTNTTTITAYRYNVQNYQNNVRYYIVEFPNDGSVAVQRGAFVESSLNAGDDTEGAANITITTPVSSVNKAFSNTYNTAFGVGIAFPRNSWIERITATDTITISNWRTDGANSVGSHYWQVIEFIPTLTVGDGTDPGDATIAPGSSLTDLDSFTLQTTEGTDTVSEVTVNLGGDTTRFDTISITSDDGATVYGSASVGAQPQTISLSSNITANTTLTQYKVRVTPLSHAAMPGVPGGTYTLTGVLTGVTSNFKKSYNETDSATITIDNQSPSDASGFTGIDQLASVKLDWTNPASDYGLAMILRNTSTPITDVPVEGAAYTAGNSVGSSTVIYAAAGTGAGSADTYTDNTVTTSDHYYKIFVQDAYGNWSTPGDEIGPHKRLACSPVITALTISASKNPINETAPRTSTITVTPTGDTVTNPEWSSDGGSSWYASGTDYTAPFESKGVVAISARATEDTCLTEFRATNEPYVINYDTRNTAITLGAMSLNAPLPDQIDVTWPYTNDKNINATASYRYRTTSGPGAWSTPASMFNNYGVSFTASITGLATNTSYDVEVTVTDGDGVTGTNPQTQTVSTQVADNGAPDAITITSASAAVAGHYLLVTWTAVGRDPLPGGAGTSATSYDMRFSKKEIVQSGASSNQTNWASAASVTTLGVALPTPAVAGTTESLYVTGLESNTTYYYAIKATDDFANTSAISNSPSGKTGLMFGWNMVSSPVTPSPNDTNSVFGDDANYDWMWYWTPAGATTPISNGAWSQESIIARDMGYLIWSEANTPTDAAGTSNGGASTDISLHPGYNLIGTPYEGIVNLNDCQVSNGGAFQAYATAVGSNWIDNSIWIWDGDEYIDTLYTSAILEPWKGYWILIPTDADDPVTLRVFQP